MYPHIKLNNLKKRYQDQLENAYLTVKVQELGSQGNPAPWPIFAHFTCTLSLCDVSKVSEKSLGSPQPNPGSTTAR